jgi:hypothetical protein
MSIRAYLSLIGVCLAAAGCQQPPVGAYRAEGGDVTYRLEADGRAYVTVLGTTVAATYTADAERVIVSGPQGTTVLARREGALLGPTGLVLYRVDAAD